REPIASMIDRYDVDGDYEFEYGIFLYIYDIDVHIPSDCSTLSSCTSCLNTNRFSGLACQWCESSPNEGVCMNGEQLCPLTHDYTRITSLPSCTAETSSGGPTISGTFTSEIIGTTTVPTTTQKERVTLPSNDCSGVRDCNTLGMCIGFNRCDC